MNPSSPLQGRLAAAALVVLSCLAVGHARAAKPALSRQAASPRVPQRYSLFDFGVAPSGQPRMARAISNSGWVVGSFELDFFDTRGFAWKDSLYYNRLPLPGGSSSTVTDVNEAGVAAGSALNADFLSRPCRWGSLTLPVDLEPGSEEYEEAFGINNLGAVVGYGINPDGEVRGAVWYEGVKTLLPTLGGLMGQANAVNDAGQVVGTAETLDGWTHACLWESGAPTDLGTLGGLDSAAYAINASGQIAGSATDNDGFLQPVVWEQGVIRPLELMEGAEGEALGLNGQGHVVGEVLDAELVSSAVRWIGGTPADLNALIPGGTGWILERALDINDRGQIVAAGTLNGEPRSCLLTPVATDLSVVGTTTPAPGLAGRALTVNLTVRNSGPNASPESRLTLTLPPGVTLSSASPAYTQSGSELTFDLGTLSNGATRTATVVVIPSAPGSLSFGASVSSAEYDPDAADDSTQITTTVAQPQADLRITQTANPETGVAEELLTYTLTVHNEGPHAAEGVIVTNMLPSGVELVSTSPAATRAENTLTFALGNLGVQETAGLTIEVRPETAGTLSNTVTLSSATPDPDPQNNTSSLTTTVTPEPGPDLTGSWQGLYARCRGAGRALRCNLTGSFRVRNSGSQAAGASTLRLLLSEDAIADAQDTPVKSVPIRALGAGEAVEIGISGQLPRGISPAGKYVLAVIDADGRVSEPVETNNEVAYGPLPTLPDLAGSWQEVTHVCRGPENRRRCSVRGNLTVRNEGADSKPGFIVRLLLSSDSMPDPGDRKLRDIRVRSLAAGATRTIKFVATLPRGVEAAGQYVLAVIDAAGAVPESDETNNILSHGPLE